MIQLKAGCRKFYAQYFRWTFKSRHGWRSDACLRVGCSSDWYRYASCARRRAGAQLSWIKTEVKAADGRIHRFRPQHWRERAVNLRPVRRPKPTDAVRVPVILTSEELERSRLRDLNPSTACDRNKCSWVDWPTIVVQKFKSYMRSSVRTPVLEMQASFRKVWDRPSIELDQKFLGKSE